MRAQGCYLTRPGISLLLLLLSLLSAGITTSLASGTDGTNLRVTVLDPAGAVIAGARVHVKAGDSDPQKGETNRQGEALFAGLPAGKYHLHVEAQGFASRDIDGVSLRPGNNHIEVRLRIADVKEDLVVKQDRRIERTDPRGDSFATILTAEQIENLPDDPEEMEAALKRLAGPGAVIRVNGFKGGRLPPKSQIRQIRFRRNSYAAEYHESGFTGVDIVTKPGVDNLHGSLAIAFRDEALNARNAFAPRRAPEQLRRFEGALDIPLWPNRTSLFLTAEGYSSFDSQAIVAELPSGRIDDVITRPSRSLYTSFKVIHAISKTHTMSLGYERNGSKAGNLGVGTFDLPDRAYSSDSSDNFIRLSESGTVGKRLFNELRFQARWQGVSMRSAVEAPAIIVLDAFSSGGAQRQNNNDVLEFDIADNVDFASGSHAMRAGVLFESGSYRLDSQPNAIGTFTFASLDDFKDGRPTIFTRRVGSNPVRISQSQMGLYWQDDWRLQQGLTLSFGLRYERQSNLDDNNNFAPRVGLAWSPFKDGRTTIRAGAGIFYDWFGADTYGEILSVNGRQQLDLVIQDPGYPNPFSGGSRITLPPSRFHRAPDMINPYVEQASVGVEREVTRGLFLRTTYLYNRGVHLLRGHNINAPLPAVGRPDPKEGNIIQVESTANSSRHLLHLSLNSAMSKRLYWIVDYSMSKSINEADGPFSLPANNFDLRAESGPSPDDSRHRLFANLGLTVFKGLRLSTTFYTNSGLPYNITTGRDGNGDTVFNDRPEGLSRNSLRGAAQWNVDMRLSWLGAFGERGGASRAQANSTIVVSGSDVGALASEVTAAEKRWRINLYVQAFNLLNHTNPFSYTGVLTSPFFGRATAALPGRRVEAGTRFSF